jgi:hypothetical protein
MGNSWKSQSPSRSLPEGAESGGKDRVRRGFGAYGGIQLVGTGESGVGRDDGDGGVDRCDADQCGVVDKLGTVEVGKLADLIVVSANPLDDIRNIHELKYVFKDGRLVESRQPEGLANFWELFFFG